MRRPPQIAPRRPSQARSSTTQHERLYGSRRWRIASERFRASPEGALCRPCRARGKLVPSAAVDHIVPHAGDLELFWSEANWQGICASCHSSKTRSDEYVQKTGQIRLRPGCDSSGFPLDERHPWHRS
jgi:5-methylcytosine-specific restriction enzyme A